MAPKRFSTWNIEEEVKIEVAESGVNAFPTKTVPQALKENLVKHGNAPGFHFKKNGVWQSVTFNEYYQLCRQFGKALLKVGLQRFQGVSIIGFNSLEWVVADIGTILAGGVSAGIYTTNSPPACEYIAKHSDSAVVVCDGMKQLEKFLAIQKNLPKLKALVIYNDKVPENINSKVPVYSWEGFLKHGADVADADLDKRIEVQKPGQCAVLIYTSGTTGDPKAVMLSHDNINWMIEAMQVEFKQNHKTDLDNSHRLVSYLPMSHVAAQMIDIMLPSTRGSQIFFAQPDALKGTLGQTLKEARPTLFFGVPRVYEKIAEKLWSVSAQTTGLKKSIAEWAKGIGRARSELARYGNSGGDPCGYGVAHFAVLGRIKEALGLDQCIACFTGAAPISQDIIDYFSSLDIPVYEFYGQSETCGPTALCMKGIWKVGSCGRDVAGCTMKVVPGSDELICKGRNNMMGYLKSEKQTREAIDEDGWLHSGDAGKKDEDGFNFITGRIKELIITAGGENVPPVLIEDAIKEEIPALSNVMVIGDRRKFLTALFSFRSKMDSEGSPLDQLDGKALSIFKELGSTATTVAEAKTCPKVKQYLDAGLKRANSRATSRAQNVGKYHILDKDFSLPGGELTPTLKLKRKVVMDKYADIIEGLYGNK